MADGAESLTDSRVVDVVIRCDHAEVKWCYVHVILDTNTLQADTQLSCLTKSSYNVNK